MLSYFEYASPRKLMPFTADTHLLTKIEKDR